MDVKICVVTGTRAEYGLLTPLMGYLRDDKQTELQLVVTGMHLSPEFGLTYRQIVEDDFEVSGKVEMLLSSDTAVGIAKSIGLGVIGFADIYDRLQPDLVVLLGDRYEILAAAQAALVAKIPIAHIGGGDITEGAYDEAIRHSISKMSHLHFVTNEDSARRLRQLGEDPRYIFNVGTPAIDLIQRLPLASKEELGQLLDFSWRPRNMLVTFHPVTLDEASPAEQFAELLSACESLNPNDFGIIITKPNSDNDGRTLIHMIDEFAARHENVKAFTSLGQYKYLSTMAQVDVIMGNSSSGLYEAPSFQKPTVNIGDRQKGRLQAGSVFNCPPKKAAILAALQQALSADCSGVRNPYGDGRSAERTYEIIKNIGDYKALVKKSFYEMEGRS